MANGQEGLEGGGEMEVDGSRWQRASLKFIHHWHLHSVTGQASHGVGCETDAGRLQPDFTAGCRLPV